MIKEQTNPERPDNMTTEDTTIALCLKKKSERKVAQGTILVRFDNVKSETTNTLAPEELFEVLWTEVFFFAKHTTR